MKPGAEKDDATEEREDQTCLASFWKNTRHRQGRIASGAQRMVQPEVRHAWSGGLSRPHNTARGKHHQANRKYCIDWTL